MTLHHVDKDISLSLSLSLSLSSAALEEGTDAFERNAIFQTAVCWCVRTRVCCVCVSVCVCLRVPAKMRRSLSLSRRSVFFGNMPAEILGMRSTENSPGRSEGGREGE